MGVRLKPLREQVVVLTGATSGIGLVTARRAAAGGARLVLAARNEEALQALRDEINAQGRAAVYAVADVGVEEQVRGIARLAMERFGGFDTWINNAAVAIYGKVEDIDIEDHRRLFETNYWGVVYGSRIACDFLRARGGKLINIGSALGERGIPLQGVYSASKAAVGAFTAALRMELAEASAPVSVTLIKPGAIDTPYKDHAANYMDLKGKNPPPVYAPEEVARAILYAAEHEQRERVVGAGGKLLTTLGNMMPGLADRVMTHAMPRAQRSDEPSPGVTRGTLYQPGQDTLRERGGYPHTLEHSLYSAAGRRPLLTAALGVGAAAAIYGLAKSRGGRSLTRH